MRSSRRTMSSEAPPGGDTSLRHMKTTVLKPVRRLSGDERAMLRKLVSEARLARTANDFAKREGTHFVRR